MYKQLSIGALKNLLRTLLPDLTVEQPIWLTAQEWLNSRYHKEWNPEGKYHVLFDIGRNQSMCKVFPIYPAAELMIQVREGWCYQPYGCRCEATGGVTTWVYVNVTDFSLDYNLKTVQGHIEHELAFDRYSRYTWSRVKAFEDLGIDFNLKTVDGELSCRSSVTHQELQRILEIPELKAIWEDAQEKALKNLSWYKTTPSKETPVRAYAAGGDDSSYTKLYATLELAMGDIERFKVKGMPEHPESEDWVFTN